MREFESFLMSAFNRVQRWFTLLNQSMSHLSVWILEMFLSLRSLNITQLMYNLIREQLLMPIGWILQ